MPSPPPVTPPRVEPEPFVLDHAPSFGGRIHGLVQTPTRDADAGPRPTVVICHGFKGFMTWGFFPPLADLLVDRGFTVVRFNFSGSGQGPDDERVTDPEAFRRNTISLERDETLHVLDHLETIAPDRVDPKRIGLVGHSRGGAAVLLAATSDRWLDRLGAMVTWAAVGTVHRYPADLIEAWRGDGVVQVQNSRTGQLLEIGTELLDDLEQHREALDLEAAATRRKAPWLIAHGGGDESVVVDEAHRLSDAAARGDLEAAPIRVEILPGASHTFGARHPFAGPTPDLIHVMNATQQWLRQHLA
ncbi:MAG: alpha/beta fold hydrolase [Acidobacteriota bacterium]